VTLASIAYTLNSVRTEKPQYRSRATVRLVDESRALAGDVVGSTPSAEMPFSPTSDPIQSQIQILQSEAVASQAVETKGLRVVPASGDHWVDKISAVSIDDSSAATGLDVTFGPASYSVTSGGATASAPYGQEAAVNGIRLTVSEKPKVPSVKLAVISKEQAINDLLGRFKVSGRPRTDILDLSYTGDEPNQTQRIANAVADAYQKYNADRAKAFSQRRRAFLEAQLKQYDSALNASSAAFSSFRAARATNIAQAAEQATTVQQIDQTRVALLAERDALEALLSKAREASPQELPAKIRGLASTTTGMANGAVTGLFSQLMAQENARDLMIDGGAALTNPDLIKMNNQIATTGRRMIEAVESQLESVKARIAGLDRARPSGIASRAAATTVGETRETQLGNDLQMIQRLASNLKDELEKAKLSEAVEAGQVQIVQLARYPGYRIATQTGRQVMIGLLVGLMFGFGAAVVVDSLDKSIRKRGDIEPMLGIPGLVVIPRLASAGPNRRLKALPRRGVQRASRSDNQMLDLVTIADPRSPSAEAFRTLRTNLMFSQAVDEMRTLVVTSASPGEGKTITAANLAVAFAQQGMRILLVDSDLRRGRLNRVFGIPREPGLSELVLGYEPEDKVTRETSVAGLYVIPSGKLPPNPAEMLGGQHARETLAKLTEGYDLVIIDTPPLLAASDAAILATLSDGVIMVLRAGSTESAAAQQAMQQLNAIGARVVGAVLNDPESEVAKYGAYYEYNYKTAEA
jgi:capsular exopolysaccharide synthesis family protein